MAEPPIEIEVLGLAELDRKLKALGNKMAGKALYSALNVALTPVVKEAKKRALVAEEEHIMTKKGGSKVEVKPGLLKSSIRKRRLKKKEHKGRYKNGAAMGVYIGKGTKQKEYPNYWHFIEYGTPHMPATPFIRPAFDNNIQVMIDTFKKKLAENIEKYETEMGAS